MPVSKKIDVAFDSILLSKYLLFTFIPIPNIIDDRLDEYIFDSNKIPQTFLLLIIISLGHFIKDLLSVKLFIALQTDNPAITDKN